MAHRPSILFSYTYVPWWHFRFCDDALREFADVKFVGSAFLENPGFPADMNIAEFISKTGTPVDYYLGAEIPLHRGIPDLACPTAMVIGDYWPGNHDRIQTARLFDHVFVTSADGMRDFRAGGCKRVHFLPFAADLRFHRDFQLERIYDVGFVGFTNLKTQQGRGQALANLAARYKMNDFTQPAFGEEVGRIYSQSKIVVNFPRNGGFNMRVFEAMASGALLITEDIGNGQNELFEAGKHLVLYRDQSEIPGLVDYYLTHEAERLAISRAGQKEVLEKHTYGHRMEFLIQVLTAAGSERNRTQDKDEIIKVYATSYGRAERLDHLVRELFKGKGSLGTRCYVLARLIKSVINILFPPRF